MTKLVFYNWLSACLIDTRWPTQQHTPVWEVLVSDVLTGCRAHLNVVCCASVWMNSRWMYMCVPLLFYFIFLNEHLCTLSELLYLSSFFFFFCYSSSVAIKWVYFSLWYNQNKSPTRGPFMLDVTKEEFGSKKIKKKSIHCHICHSVFLTSMTFKVFLINFVMKIL